MSPIRSGQTNAAAPLRERDGKARKPAPKPRAGRHIDIHPLDRAIAELRAELARTPDDPTLLGRLGALHYRRGDLVEAEKCYRGAILLAPHRPTLFNNLGNVLCDMGHMRDGIAAYEHAIALERAADPSRDPSAEALVNLELAKTENRLIHERIEYLERAAQLDVSSAEAVNTLGCGYLLRGQRPRALETFRKAAAMDSRNLWAALNVAYAHTLNLGGPDDLQAALAEIAESILRFPGEARLHIHQGELFENSGLLEEAEERYLRAAQADAHCLEAYDLLGRLRQAAGTCGARDETAAAVETLLEKLQASAGRDARPTSAGTEAGPAVAFERAFARLARAEFQRTAPSPENAEGIDKLLRDASASPELSAPAAVLRARLLIARNRAQEAQVVLENFKSSGAAQSGIARVWFERGTLAFRAGHIDQAVEAYDQATLRTPQDARAWHALRFAFEGFRRYKAERVRFENAVKSNPRDALAHHHLALAALSVLKNDEALKHFSRALELDPRLSDAACGRGRVLQRLEREEEAAAAFEKALAIDPENGEAQRWLLNLRAQKLPAADAAPPAKPRSR